jgi:thioesterase domain-containing protein/acyl carrier protein
VEHCLAIRAYFELDTRDRVLQSGSTSFDLSLEEILPTLITGATLIVQSRDLWPAADFHKAITKYGLTVINLPTAYWQELARGWAVAATAPQVTTARLFIVGGDTLAPASLSLWRQTPFSSARLVNAYGPTEATITATTFEIALDSKDQMTLQRIPIGRPLAGRETYILDKYGNLVPIGVAGNLHIGGVGLARGYLNRPELTAEKFVPHPFSSAPGARLYETGDVARYLPDGNIEFLGRADQQVKIRGYRIELEEVEAVLARHPEVRHAAVVAQVEASGEQRLVAYVVNEPGRSPTLTELRGFLQGHLPEYMVPAIFIALEALPLTPNGKVDRNALPPLDGARPDLEKGFIAPRDVLELQLTQLWEEVLGVRPVGVRDNFFELGGHSLAAVRLFALIEHRLGRKLPLATVFQGATVEHLATILRERTEHQSSLVAIQPSGDLRPLFLIHPAGGHVFPYVQLARSLGLNQPCYGLQARGLEEGQEPHTQIEDMATHYIEALRTLQPQGPYHIGGWSAGGVVAFEMAQQLLAQGQQVALLALLDARIPGPEEDFADDDFEATLLADFIRYFGLSLDSRESLARLPKDELLSRVLAQAKLAGLVPQDVEASQAHPFIELCKADFRATRNYVPRRYPGRVTLFRAAQELAGMSSDPMLGWSKWAAEGVEVHVVPGNHASMVYKPHVDVLAQMINECLKQVRLSENQLTDSEADDQPETRWLDD